MELLDRSGFVPIVADFINPPEPGGDKGRFAIVASRAPTQDAGS